MIFAKTARLGAFLFVVVSALSLSGCAGLQAQWAKEHRLQQDLDAYVIKKPLKEVWESVTLVNGPNETLLWNGTGWTWADDGPWKKKTSKRTSKEKSLGDDQTIVEWYECEGKEVAGGSQVHYSKITERTTVRDGKNLGTSRNVERRTDLELELVQRFDPKGAARIKTAGDRAARAQK